MLDEIRGELLFYSMPTIFKIFPEKYSIFK